ncbi:hypothetical protein [Neolewinella sp.]|uniref:hypothetical protein n=1 Tax=Neolewinella sp. TaxID=2993543 RepID=UPI003B519F1A
MNALKVVPVLVILVAYGAGPDKLLFVFSEQQSYWSVYNLDYQHLQSYDTFEDSQDSTAISYNNITAPGIPDDEPAWTADTVMADWPLTILSHTSSGDNVQNLERELVRTFEHPLLPYGHCYEYSLRYDGRIQITDSINTVHHVWCDAPPEMNERQRLIYNRKLLYFPEFLLDSIQGRPVIFTEGWFERETDSDEPYIWFTKYSAEMRYDTIDMDRYKQGIRERIDLMQDTLR